MHPNQKHRSMTPSAKGRASLKLSIRRTSLPKQLHSFWRLAVASGFAAYISSCASSSTTQLDSGFAVDSSTTDATFSSDAGPSLWDGDIPFVSPVSGKIDLLVVGSRHPMISAYDSAPIPWVISSMRTLDPSLDLRLAIASPNLGDPLGERCAPPDETAGQFVDCEPAPWLWRSVEEDVAAEALGQEILCRTLRPECAYQQPLDAMLSAVLPEGSGVPTNAGQSHGDGANAGFFREDAFLAILIASDTEDCSFEAPLPETDGPARSRCFAPGAELRPLQHYASALLRLRPRNSFGVFLVGPLPFEVSGQPATQILADPRMEPVPQNYPPVGWELWASDATPVNYGAETMPGRRLVSLIGLLESEGVRTGAFSMESSYRREFRIDPRTPQQVFEDAAEPIARRILGRHED